MATTLNTTIRTTTLLKSIVIGAGGCLFAPSFVLVPIAGAVSGRAPMTPIDYTFVAGGLAIGWIAVRAWLRTRHNPEPGVVGALGRHSIWIMAAGLGLALYASYRFAHGLDGRSSGGAVPVSKCDDLGKWLAVKVARTDEQVEALPRTAVKLTAACTADRWSPEAIACFDDRALATGLRLCADLLTPVQRASVPELIDALQ